MARPHTPSRGKKKSFALRATRTATISAALLIAPSVVLGQGTTASLSGTVTDASGAVIPNAAITLKNQATSDVRQSTSNGSGDFTFSAVPVGNYEIDVASPGFQQFKEGGIHLDPGDQRSLHELKLDAGSESQTVNVREANQSITLDSGEQSSLISAEDIKHLSVEGRDVTELLKILPGFAITAPSGGLNQAYDPSQVSVNGALGSYAGNGTTVNTIALLSDGVDITDPGNFGAAIQNINYEQVAEVKVQTSSFTADEARGPIVIDAVGKSGGDHFHGSLYTYARTYELDAADWLANNTGQMKPPDRQVYPGFTLGGPIYVPGVNFNRNKRLTFFVGAEDYAQRDSYAYGSAGNAILDALVPTQAMRNGDFSAASLQTYLGNYYTNSGYAGLATTPVTNKAGGAITNGQILANNDPVTTLLVNTLPLPNEASANGFNYITTNLIDNDLWQARGRVDYAINDKNKLFIVYSKEAGKNGVPQVPYYSPRGNLGGVDVPGGGLLSTINSEIGSLNYTTIISPTITNEIYVGGSWLLQNFVDKDFAATTLNGQYTYGGLFNNGTKVFPEFEDYGNDGLPLSLLPDTTDGGIYAKKWVRTGGDNLTKVLGKHTIRIGFFTQLDTNHEVVAFVPTNGGIENYYFPESITDPVQGLVHYTGAVGSGSGGNPLANFLAGGVGNFNQSNIAPSPNIYFWNVDGYAQDHWRVTPHLTLDYGVRFDHLTPWGDAHQLGIPVFSAAAYKAGTNAILPGFSWHGIDPSVPNTGLATRWAYVEARLGFAWDAYGTGQTVVRGGYGTYRAHDSFNDATNGIATVDGERNVNVGGLLLSSVSSQAAQFNTASGFTPDSTAYGFYANDSEQPEVYTYNLAVDQKAPYNSLIELAYIGNTSKHLLNNGSNQSISLDNINALHPGALFGPDPMTGITLPLLPPTGSINNTNSANSVVNLSSNQIDQYRPYPLYHSLQIAQHNVYGNYNSLQASWNKQQGRAFYGINYTYSKALGVLGADGNGTPIDPFNYRDSYVPLSFDRTNIFNASYSYTFGKILKNRYAGAATNGWELSGITNKQSGGNFISQNTSNFNLEGSYAVPNQTGQPTTLSVTNQNFLGTPDEYLQPVITCNPGIHLLPHQYVNGNCFAVPQIGQNGTLRPPYIHEPAYTDSDLTASKDFGAGEGRDVQFRLAAFNFLNYANRTISTTVQPNALNLNYNDGNSTPTVANIRPISEAIAQTPNSNAAIFGLAPLRTGRRVLELSLKFNF
jgi:hypothetical protein